MLALRVLAYRPQFLIGVRSDPQHILILLISAVAVL